MSGCFSRGVVYFCNFIPPFRLRLVHNTQQRNLLSLPRLERFLLFHAARPGGGVFYCQCHRDVIELVCDIWYRSQNLNLSNSYARPKPPSDEGGGSKSRRERILPLSQPARLTAPLTRGALGAPAPVKQT